jgi:hypothetical protein
VARGGERRGERAPALLALPAAREAERSGGERRRRRRRVRGGRVRVVGRGLGWVWVWVEGGRKRERRGPRRCWQTLVQAKERTRERLCIGARRHTCELMVLVGRRDFSRLALLGFCIFHRVEPRLATSLRFSVSRAPDVRFKFAVAGSRELGVDRPPESDVN